MDASITSSIIAASAALLGVALSGFGGMLRSALDKGHERNALLRAKLEELADNVHRTTEWSIEMIDTASERGVRLAALGEGRQFLAVSAEARRVHVLALMYFPSMKEEAKNLLTASHDMYLQFSHSPDIDREKLQDATNRFGAARKAIDNLVTAEAKKIT